jgi:hypothetical protein
MDKTNIDKKSSWRNDLSVRGRQAAVDWTLANERHLRQTAELVKEGSTMWKEGNDSEQSGRIQKLHGVLKIGQALAAGKRTHSSNNKFNDWIKTLGLESPFDDRQERTAAIKISEFFGDGINPVNGNIVDGKLPVIEKLFSCPHTRPNDVVKWMRKTGLIPVKKRNPEATAQARAQIRVAVENGQTVSRDEVSETTGLSDGAVGRATVMEQGRLEGIAEGEAIALNEQGKFTKAQAKHVEALIKKHRRDLDAQFVAAVEVEVNKQVGMRKASLARAQEACVKQKNDAHADQQRWRRLIDGHKFPLTRTEYVDIQWVLRNEHASQDRRDRATIAFEAKELQLIGEK